MSQVSSIEVDLPSLLAEYGQLTAVLAQRDLAGVADLCLLSRVVSLPRCTASEGCERARHVDR